MNAKKEWLRRSRWLTAPWFGVPVFVAMSGGIYWLVSTTKIGEGEPVHMLVFMSVFYTLMFWVLVSLIVFGMQFLYHGAVGYRKFVVKIFTKPEYKKTKLAHIGVWVILAVVMLVGSIWVGPIEFLRWLFIVIMVLITALLDLFGRCVDMAG